MRALWAELVKRWEAAFDAKEDLGKVSHTKLIDLNAAASRNYIYDKKGNKWPYKEAL